MGKCYRAPPHSHSWQVSEVIGQGSFGKVYFGLNVETGQQMAIKQVELKGINKMDPVLLFRMQVQRIRALEIEIKLLSKLKHRNIVQYLGMQRTEQHLNIFLEYVGGKVLRSPPQ